MGIAAIDTIALAVLTAAAIAGAPAAGPASASDPAVPVAGSAAAPVELAEDTAKWESGYGVRFFQVVGSVTNRGDRPLGAIRVHTELLDDSGGVVAETDCWNGDAEALGDLAGEAAKQKLARSGIKPIVPGASDKWRCTFVEEDAPKFSRHRARVAATLPAP